MTSKKTTKRDCRPDLARRFEALSDQVPLSELECDEILADVGLDPDACLAATLSALAALPSGDEP